MAQSTPHEYELSRKIGVSPDEAYAFIKDPANLTQYLPMVTSATALPGDRVAISVNVGPHQHDAEGAFTTNESDRKIEWGSDSGDYAGWAQVEEDGSDSRLVVNLTWSRGSDYPEVVDEKTRVSDPIEEGMEAALESIANILEGVGGVVEPPKVVE